MYLSRLSIFFIEYHAIEPFPAFDEFLGEIQMAAGNKAEATEMFFATIASASSIRFEI